MRLYCKAYLLRDLRPFPGWHESSPGEDEQRTDEDVVYLWDDYTVVDNPVLPDQESNIVFATVTPEWQQFCVQTLQFVVPDDVREMNEELTAASS